MADDHHHEHGDQPHSHMVHHHRDVQGGAERAAVFGVSDGLVSNVALILGVSAAAQSGSSVLIAGLSGLLAGAASMAAGEYVSMKAQAELVERELEIERRSIEEQPQAETEELAAIYRDRGIGAAHATSMAEAVMADPEVALEVHAREELGVDPDDTGDPGRVACQVEQEPGLCLGRGGLNDDRAVDAMRGQMRGQFVGEDIAADRRHGIVHPVIVAPVDPPEMMMRVDTLRTIHARSPT